MNIYDLARQLLEMYDDAEQILLDESSMSTEKYNRKMKALDEEVRGFYDQIKKLEDEANATNDTTTLPLQ